MTCRESGFPLVRGATFSTSGSVSAETIRRLPTQSDRLRARIQRLEHFPEIGRARPDISDQARVIVERPYLILYRCLPTGVQIVRVVHGARRIEPALIDERLH